MAERADTRASFCSSKSFLRLEASGPSSGHFCARNLRPDVINPSSAACMRPPRSGRHVSHMRPVFLSLAQTESQARHGNYIFETLVMIEAVYSLHQLQVTPERDLVVLRGDANVCSATVPSKETELDVIASRCRQYVAERTVHWVKSSLPRRRPPMLLASRSEHGSTKPHLASSSVLMAAMTSSAAEMTAWRSASTSSGEGGGLSS